MSTPLTCCPDNGPNWTWHYDEVTKTCYNSKYPTPIQCTYNHPSKCSPPLICPEGTAQHAVSTKDEKPDSIGKCYPTIKPCQLEGRKPTGKLAYDACIKTCASPPWSETPLPPSDNYPCCPANQKTFFYDKKIKSVLIY